MHKPHSQEIMVASKTLVEFIEDDTYDIFTADYCERSRELYNGLIDLLCKTDKPVVLRDKSKSIGGMVTKGPNGNWRVTSFSERGFLGDSGDVDPTKRDAVRRAIQEYGFRIPDTTFLPDMMKLDSFHAGNDASLRIS